MNKVFLSGNLTRDPEVRYTQSGKSFARVGLAVKRPFSKDAVDFFNLVAWEKTADFLGKWFKKGNRILIDGRLQTSTYEKNGVKINSTEVLIENVEFAGDNKKATTDDDLQGEPVDDGDYPF